MSITVNTDLVKRGNSLRTRALWREANVWLGLDEILRCGWVKRLPGVLVASLLVTVFLLWIGVQAESLLAILPLIGLPLVIAILFDG